MRSFRNDVAESPVAQAAAPQLAPEPREHTRQKSRYTGLIVLIVGTFISGILISLLYRRNEEKRTLVSANMKSSVRGLRLKGTTEAIRARSILAPTLSGQQVGTLTITNLLQAGTYVKAGEVLVEFDRQSQVRDALEKQAEYDKLVDQLAQEQAKEDVARAKDETELHQAESDFRKAQLEMEKSDILSRIDLEKAQETLEQAQATSQQLHSTFDLKRRAASAAIRILEIQRDRIRQTMHHAQGNAALMQVHSPIDGVVVLNTIWKEGKIGEVQEGDQIRPGMPFMEVVDRSQMRVVVQVNQEDFLALKIGERVKVRLDAYPDLVFEGLLQEVAPIGRSGRFSAKVRTFTATFSIEGSEPRLMPDLSAAVDLDAVERTRAASGAR